MKERIIQFGEGGFLRGFAGWMLDIVNEKTDFNGKAVVGLILGIFGAVFGIVLMIVNSLLAEDFFKRFFEIIEDASESKGNIESDF